MFDTSETLNFILFSGLFKELILLQKLKILIVEFEFNYHILAKIEDIFPIIASSFENLLCLKIEGMNLSYEYFECLFIELADHQALSKLALKDCFMELEGEIYYLDKKFGNFIAKSNIECLELTGCNLFINSEGAIEFKNGLAINQTLKRLIIDELTLLSFDLCFNTILSGIESKKNFEIFNLDCLENKEKMNILKRIIV